MKPCHSCQAVIDKYILDRKLEMLRDLTAGDFNLCADYTTVVANAYVGYGGGVYVPRGETAVPDYCPTCRADLIQRAGNDPG